MLKDRNVSNIYFLLVISVIIFAINFSLKLIYIGKSSFWYDESISATYTLVDFGHLKHQAEWDKNPPFYHYALWIWQKFFGITEVGLRSMSAFFSALTAVLIFLFTNKIKNLKSGLIASFIFLLHPYLFYYAQEARCYSFLIFLITSNLYLLYYFTLNQKSKTAFFIGVLNFCIFYTHYIAGLILFCQFIYIIFLLKTNFKNILLLYLTPILLVLIRFTRKQYDVLFFSNEMSKKKANVPLSDIKGLNECVESLFTSKIIFLIVLILIVFFFIKNKKSTTQNYTLLKFEKYIILSPIFCIALLYYLGTLTNVFNQRYLIFSLPYFVISLAILLPGIVYAIFFLVLYLSLNINKIEFGASREMDYRQAALITKSIQKTNDVNILLQTHDIVSLFYYYYNPTGYKNLRYDNWEILKKEKIYWIENIDEAKDFDFSNKNIILYFQTYVNEEDSNKIINYLKTINYKVVYQRNVSKAIKMFVIVR